MPKLNLRTAAISGFHKKGVHTTTGSRMFSWEFGGQFIDTPGIKTFQIHKESKSKLYRLFPGFDKLYAKCKFIDCTHTHEKDCCVLEAVKSGEIPRERYDSYVRILNSL